MPTRPMPQPSNDPVLHGIAVGMMLISIWTDLQLIARRRAGPLLPYESRRPVPWGAAGTVPAMLLLLFTFYSAYSQWRGDASQQPLSTTTLIASMLQQVIFVVGFLFVIAVLSHATPRDLGLPASKAEVSRDVFMGAIACLAALAPVHIQQILLMHALHLQEESSGHPLVKMVMSGPPNVGILLMTGLVAVVIAPICEEITFRLLLQGWLEKCEDRWLGWSANTTESPMTNDEARTTNDEEKQSEHSSLESALPRRGVAGLPYGAFPIFISAFLFGLAHLGYGPEPLPLFMLGLALGFVYQRTHRIIPSIVAHALFNLFTMVMLWRLVTHAN